MIPKQPTIDEREAPFRELRFPWSTLRSGLRAFRRRRIQLLLGSKFRAGSELHLGAHADIRPPHFFVAGDYVAIGKNFICEVDCELGREILISSNVAFVGNQHRFDSPDSSVYWQGRVENDVVKIGNDCLIGFGTIVVGNVTVGDGCIVGAGSVVTRDLPPGFVCVGAPARPIRRRFGS